MDYSYYYEQNNYQESPLHTFIKLALAVLLLASYWKLFQKANKPGWAAIVPFYNLYTLFDLSMGSGWKMFTLLIPFYNIYVAFKFYFSLAEAYNKSKMWGLGLMFLPHIFFPIMAFSPNIVYGGSYYGNYGSGSFVAGGQVPQDYAQNYYQNTANNQYNPENIYGQNNNTYGNNDYYGQTNANNNYYGQTNANNNDYYGQTNANNDYYGQVNANNDYYGQSYNNNNNNNPYNNNGF